MVWSRLLASIMESRRSSSESVSAKATNLVELDTTERSRCVVRGARWNWLRRFTDSSCAQPTPAAAPGTQIAGDRLASFRVESAASIRLDIMSERLTPRAKSGETHVNVLTFFWRLASDLQIPSLGLETRQLGPQSRDHFGKNLHLLNCWNAHWAVSARRPLAGTSTARWPRPAEPQTLRQLVLLENHVFLELSFSVLGFAICFFTRSMDCRHESRRSPTFFFLKRKKMEGILLKESQDE